MTDKPDTETNTLLADIDRAIETCDDLEHKERYRSSVNPQKYAEVIEALTVARDFIQKCTPNEGTTSATMPAQVKEALEIVEIKRLQLMSKSYGSYSGTLDLEDCETIRAAILALVARNKELMDIINDNEYALIQYQSRGENDHAEE